MQLDSNIDGSSCDALILACFDSVKVMAWGFARRSSRIPVEVDEMYAVGMLAVCEAAARGVEADTPMAYLCKVAQYAMIDEYRRLHGWSTASLDAPLSDDSLLSLSDILPALVPSAPAASSQRSQALNEAMRRLVSSRQRAVLRRRYGLPGYGASTLKEAARSLRTTVGAIDSAGCQGLCNLARDPRLCKVVGVEVVR